MPAIKRATLIATSVVIITCAGFYSASVAQMHSSKYSIDSKESTKAKSPGFFRFIVQAASVTP